MDNPHIISQDETLLDALRVINNIGSGPLVLFTVDDEQCMIGTLTDGDVRRALLRGLNINSKISEAAHRDFRFLRRGVNDDVAHIREQRELKMKLVPVLDEENHIHEIIDLEQYRSRLPVDVVLMAGGKGERLRPLTEKTPKPLLKVGDKAIIDRNIDRLMEFGVRHINVTVNYLREQIETHFAKPYGNIQVQIVREPEFLGTIGSIQFVKKFYNDVVLVMNSDLFTNIDYEDFYLHFKDNGADMSIAAVPYTVNVPYGIFDLDSRNVRGILEKPVYNYFANAGIYLVRRDVLREIPVNTFFNATDLMNKLIAEHKKVIRYPITGFWLDIGSKEEYAKANDLVKHISN